MKAALTLLALLGGAVAWMLLGDSDYTDTPIVHIAVDSGDRFLPTERRGVALAIDPVVSLDGGGSLRIDASEGGLVDLFEVSGAEEDLSFRQLVYTAKVRTRNTPAPVFLVMQAGVAGGPGAEMAVVGRDLSVQGDSDWTVLEASAGNPGGVRFFGATLQLQMTGPGTVWVDDIALVSRQFH